MASTPNLKNKIKVFYSCFYSFWGSLGIIIRCKTRKKNQMKSLSAPARAVYGLQLLSGNVHLLWHGGLQGLWVDICCIVILHGLQHSNPLHHGLQHGLQGNLCSGTCRASSVSFSTDLGIYKAVSITFLSPLSLVAAAQHFIPFLKYVISERITDVLIFRDGWNWLWEPCESSQPLLTEATSAALLYP